MLGFTFTTSTSPVFLGASAQGTGALALFANLTPTEHMALIETRDSLYAGIQSALVPEVISSLGTEFYGNQPDPDNPYVALLWPETMAPSTIAGLRSVTWSGAIGIWEATIADLSTAVLGSMFQLNEAYNARVPVCQASGMSVQLVSLEVSPPQKTAPQNYSSEFQGVYAILYVRFVTELMD